MKFVMVQWIVDFDSPSIFVGDGNLLLLDNLSRREGVQCPIPVRLAKITSGLQPFFSVNLVIKSDSQGPGSQNLLIK